MGILQQEAKEALVREGDRLLSHMRREIRTTTNGGAPGKPEWRVEIAKPWTCGHCYDR